jgi:hypothetical protein
MTSRRDLYLSLPAFSVIHGSGAGDNRRIEVKAEVHSGPKDTVNRRAYLVLSESEVLSLIPRLLGMITADTLWHLTEEDEANLAKINDLSSDMVKMKGVGQ